MDRGRRDPSNRVSPGLPSGLPSGYAEMLRKRRLSSFERILFVLGFALSVLLITRFTAFVLLPLGVIVGLVAIVTQVCRVVVDAVSRRARTPIGSGGVRLTERVGKASKKHLAWTSSCVPPFDPEHGR